MGRPLVTRLGESAGEKRRRAGLARLGVVAALTLGGLTWTETISAPSDGVVNPGDTFVDTITVNNGPTDATTVDVIDLFVGPLTFVDSASGCSEEPAGSGFVV